MSARSLWTQLRHVLGGYPTSATEWAVRVQSPDVTREELLVLDAWLKSDPRHADAYARAAKIGHLGLRLREHRDELARLEGYQRLKVAERGEIRSGARAGVLRWAALTTGCIVLAVSVTLFWPRSPSAEIYVAGHGEQRKVTLTDGSRMVVNTDSEARVRYDDAARVVELPKGEAFFEVAKSAQRPFIVRAGSTQVQAIGTKFSVSRSSHEIRVIVTEGRVRVSHVDGAVTPARELTPGQELRVGGTALAPQVAPVNAERETSWASGTVEFDDAPLTRVVEEVNRYTAKAFVISSPALNDIRLSGRFQVGDTESVRFALQDRFGIVATEKETEIRLAPADR